MSQPTLLTHRVEVRLDPRRRERLAAILETRHDSASNFLRNLIDREYAELLEQESIKEALAAVDRMAADNDEWVPANPEELERIIDEVAFD